VSLASGQILHIKGSNFETLQTYSIIQSRKDPFRFIKYSTIENKLCLDGLPGKLQFFSLNTLQTTQVIEVLSRNLIQNSDESYKSDPCVIKYIEFNTDWSVFASYTERESGENKSDNLGCLKFW
jgi:hypothetical protein